MSRQLLKEVYQLHNKDDLMDLKSAQSYADFPLSPAPPHFVVGIAYRKNANSPATEHFIATASERTNFQSWAGQTTEAFLNQSHAAARFDGCADNNHRTVKGSVV